jgi:hypothetical protein
MLGATSQEAPARAADGSPVAILQRLFSGHVCHTLASVCYSIYWVIRAARANGEALF